MFTGIINKTGKVIGIRERTAREGKEYSFTFGTRFKSVRVRDSIAVEGVCLTVVSLKKKKSGTDFTSEISEETMRKTTMGTLRAGREVNLEQSLRAGDRIGGHFVLGHVDATGNLQAVKEELNSKLFTFSYPPALDPFVIYKGSIAVNGISLTVASLRKGSFHVSILPFTEKGTTLKNIRTGDPVNIETDILAKVAAKQAEGRGRAARDSEDLYQKIDIDWSAIPADERMG